MIPRSRLYILTLKRNQALDPGGQFVFPTVQSKPMLYVTVAPRYTIFLENDVFGSFIVGASISHIFGQPYNNVSYALPGGRDGSPFTTLHFKIYSEETRSLLVASSVPVNSTGNLFEFPLLSFIPRWEPYQVSFHGSSPDGQQSFTATTQIYVLPSRSYGSAVKIDNLFGGLYVQNALNHWRGWYPVFPNGYYADGSYVTPSNMSLVNLDTYVAQGFNTINIVPSGVGPDQSYPTGQLEQYWDRMDELNLLNIYDMRFSFQNATQVNDQVQLWKNRTSLLMWYTADEPDGWAYPLNSTSLAYNQLKSLDPYHPVSLVLNCQNFYYQEYASGADIIFEDAYPVAINATWSIPWDTPCNLTYGDCGCDNCIGSLTDVSDRLDDIQTYQANLPGQGMKPTWAVLQAFGDQDYWKSIPSPAEVENMMMLSINHDAKGITYWIYPSTEDVNIGSGALGNVLKTEPALDFLFGANAIKTLQVQGEPLVDASAWIVGSEMMVGVVSEEYVNYDSLVTITLPEAAISIAQVLYGNSSWTLKGNQLSKTGLQGLEVSILILDVQHGH
jgi:hypothetical protein